MLLKWKDYIEHIPGKIRPCCDDFCKTFWICPGLQGFSLTSNKHSASLNLQDKRTKFECNSPSCCIFTVPFWPTIQALWAVCVVDHKAFKRPIQLFSVFLIWWHLRPSVFLWQLCLFIQELTYFLANWALKKMGKGQVMLHQAKFKYASEVKAKTKHPNKFSKCCAHTCSKHVIHSHRW